MPRRLVYLVTEDWAFYRHRLPMARAARDAGYEVHVISRIVERRREIEREGFHAHHIDWRRGSVSVQATLESAREIRRLLVAIKPAVLHNVALKPAVVGSLAAVGIGDLAVVSSINGLGSAFIGTSAKGRLVSLGLRVVLPLLLNGTRCRTIVQNPEDAAAMHALGVRAGHIVLIPGSGVDTDALQPLPDPPPPLRAAFVGRMLEDKGVRPLVEAFRLLRRDGLAIELLLAGEPDPENPTSITAAELAAWSAEPGITWAGHVEDIADVWARSHIAVLPSRREGLPKSLLEAAAFARAMVATDAPGCREIVVHGETGLLVPVDDATALAAALRQLARDEPRRLAMARNARRLVEERMSARDIGRQTIAVYDAVAFGASPPAQANDATVRLMPSSKDTSGA
ncbi:MAG: glycosyltransferase family 4 protein [Hyphomicrobiaceae bacterium]|nr:glycosyltransferase family 4 protein [Hyphomicrobiaceae bacterium]